MIQVERNSPYYNNPSASIKWPFMDLEIGDAFIVPMGKENSAHFMANYYKKKTGRVFTSRKCDDGKQRIIRIS